MRSLFLRCLSIGALATASCLPALAQQRPPACGTDQMMRRTLGADYGRWWQDYREQLQHLNAATRGARPTTLPHVIVPVVIHIIHDNGPSNISDAQVYDALRILNEVYSEQDPDTAQVIPYFKPRIGNASIEFRLARLDPNGNCTTGITRHYSTLTHSAGEAVKGLPGARWTPQHYLNIWVVEANPDGWAGYTFLPCSVAPNQEGILVLNSYFGTIGRSPNAQYNRHTLPHEVGHYLGLPHIWGGNNNAGNASNCSDDDGVADTPNTIGHLFNCDLNAVPCSGDTSQYDNVQNIMDYAGCPAMFTLGQVTLMNDGLTGNFPCRTGLGTAQNLLLTGVADGQVIPPCMPVAYLTATGPTSTAPTQRLCAGETLAFHAEAYNVAPGTPVQFQWTFPGGNPATSTAQDPLVSYPTPGTYDVRLRASNAAGSDSTTRASYVLVKTITGGATPPVVDTFDNPQFPSNPSDPLKSWEISPTSGTRWEYTGSAAAQGTGAVMLKLRNTISGNEYDLISPNIEITTGLQRPYLSFREAYAPRISGNTDKLTISVSYDCGQSWTTRAIRPAGILQTGPATPSLFVPTASQWRADSVLIQAQLAAGTHLLVRFRATSNVGSALYLDHIRLTGGQVTGLADDQPAKAALTIAPNPSDGQAMVRLSTGAAGAATVRVYDATGRLLGQPWHSATSAAREVPLADLTGKLAAGVYLVEMTTTNGTRLTQRALIY